MKKAISFMLSVVLLCVLAFVAFTEADTHFDSYMTAANPDGGGYVRFYFYTQATATAKEVGITTYEVFEKTPTGSWHSAGIFSGTLSYNTASHSLTRYFPGTAGNQYYCAAYHYVMLKDGTARYNLITSNMTTAN